MVYYLNFIITKTQS